MSTAAAHARRSTSYGAPFWRQVMVIAARSINRTVRSPAAIVPPILFPIVLLSINSAGLADATRIPGFPADSYFDFLLVVTFMQGSLFASTAAGLALGRDIDGGFLERLALTPMNGAALILGQLGGAAALGAAASCIYVLAGFVGGAEYKSGPLGVALLLLLGTITAIAFAALGAFVALRAGSAEGVQGIFPLMFASLFLSTLNMPLDLITEDWFHTIAQWNPVSYIVDGLRSLIITGWDASALAEGALVLAALLAAALLGCTLALRGRLTRT